MDHPVTLRPARDNGTESALDASEEIEAFFRTSLYHGKDYASPPLSPRSDAPDASPRILLDDLVGASANPLIEYPPDAPHDDLPIVAHCENTFSGLVLQLSNVSPTLKSAGGTRGTGVDHPTVGETQLDRCLDNLFLDEFVHLSTPNKIQAQRSSRERKENVFQPNDPEPSVGVVKLLASSPRGSWTSAAASPVLTADQAKELDTVDVCTFFGKGVEGAAQLATTAASHLGTFASDVSSTGFAADTRAPLSSPLKAKLHRGLDGLAAYNAAQIQARVLLHHLV